MHASRNPFQSTEHHGCRAITNGDDISPVSHRLTASHTCARRMGDDMQLPTDVWVVTPLSHLVLLTPGSQAAMASICKGISQERRHKGLNGVT